MLTMSSSVLCSVHKTITVLHGVPRALQLLDSFVFPFNFPALCHYGGSDDQYGFYLADLLKAQSLLNSNAPFVAKGACLTGI